MSLTNTGKTNAQAEQKFFAVMEKTGAPSRCMEKPRCEKEHQKPKVRIWGKSLLCGQPGDRVWEAMLQAGQGMGGVRVRHVGYRGVGKNGTS